jgi:Protein of unknown function (DUF4058)
MPSPFPGMDPFLEDPGLWPDVHHEIISEARAQLGDRLRPKYYVTIEERVYISDAYDPGRAVIIPDVRVAARPGWEDHPFEPSGSTGVEVAEPIVVTTLIDEEIHEARLEIVDRDRRHVVTVIEVLSPTNKVPGSRGRASFEQKRQELMHSPSHFIEIDLLRGGEGVRTRELLPMCEYLVHLSRNGKRPKALAWPIRLSQRLPLIPIPLLAGDPDSMLDLQGVLTTAYERAQYQYRLDYTREPVPLLSPEWAAWSDRLLKEKGLRPA